MASESENSVSDVNVNGDAEEYVESIMSSQRVIRIETPADSGRKRHHSESIASTVKRPRTTIRARRTLYGGSETPTPNSDAESSTDVRDIGPSSLETLITKLSADMHTLFSSLSERVDKLEKGLEQKIANKVAQVLDKRVTSEMNRIRKEVDKHIENVTESIREEVKADLETVNSKIDSLSNRDTNTVSDITLNIVIKNLPESENENVSNKVNKFLKDGLKLKDVTCDHADRKISKSASKPGVIIAKLKSNDDKRKVMASKASLKSHTQYSKVFVDHDQSVSDRVLASNFRCILNAMKCQNLVVRGSRVINLDSRNHSGSANSRSSSRIQDSSTRDVADKRPVQDNRRDNPIDNRRNDGGRRDNHRQESRDYHEDHSNNVRTGGRGRGGSRGGRGWNLTQNNRRF